MRDQRLGRQRVVVVGPGRVGTVLGRVLGRAGHRVVAVAGGSEASRRRFTSAVAGVREAASPIDVVGDDVDLVLVTTPDDVIADVVTELAVADRWRSHHRVVHTAGSHGLDVLARAALAGAGVAACHPAQTVPADAPPAVLDGAAWAVTAAPADRGWAHELVTQLGGDPVDVAEGDRTTYHAALAVGSNAVGAAVATARQLLLAVGVDEPARFLGPLVEASVAAPLARGAEALTGPVVRGDVGTVRRHLEVLDRDLPHLAAVYRDLGRVVLAQARPAMDPVVADTFDDLLAHADRRD